MSFPPCPQAKDYSQSKSVGQVYFSAFHILHRISRRKKATKTAYIPLDIYRLPCYNNSVIDNGVIDFAEVKFWQIRIIRLMTKSLRRHILSFLLTAFVKPRSTRFPKKPESPPEQSKQDTKIKTHCLSLCCRIFLKR